jgi:hypothetical protein
MQDGFFLREKPLGDSGFGVQQLWNRYNRTNNDPSKIEMIRYAG